MVKKGKSKPRKRTQMNEIIGTDTAVRPDTDIITIDPKLVDLNGDQMVSNIKEDPVVKEILDYNKSVFEIEEDYSNSHLLFTDGTILIRLIKKIPVYKGILKEFSVPVTGSKQMKPEFAKDPYFFNNVGIIVNYDSTYENDPDRWRFNTGEVVMIDPRVAMTTVLKLQGVGPFLEHGFMTYNEERSYEKLGYVKITKREIICRLPKFKLEDYEQEYFGN